MVNYDGYDICMPVFFHSAYMSDGHSEKSENATVTFIKYKNDIYVVTCNHVLEHLEQRREHLNDHGQTMMLLAKNVVIKLSAMNLNDPTKQIDIFRKIRRKYLEVEVDIVIGKLPENLWRVVQKNLSKSAIDLDCWEQPDLNNFKIGTAYGYSNEHKERVDGEIKTYCVEVTADIQSKLESDSVNITLFSEFDQPHGFYFSGMSGGPIILHTDTKSAVAAIIYEGQPGSRSEITQKYSSDSIFNQNQTLIKGVIINPYIFSNWLVDAGFKINEQPGQAQNYSRQIFN